MQSRLPWFIAAAGMLLALAVWMWSQMGNESTTAANAPFADAAATGAPPPLSGSPREQADRLFNRIMQEREAGNVDQARFFTPMAIQAYEAAEPLDADGFYHLSLIHGVAGDFDAAQRTAQQILSLEPTHLLGLAALAEAAQAAGDEAAATDAWRRYLDAYESEKALQKTEYIDHATMLTRYEADARARLGR